MILFLMASLPLTCVLLYTVYQPWRDEKEIFLRNLFWGLKMFIPGVLLYFLGIRFLSPAYTPESLFIYYLFKDYLLWFFLALAGFAVLYSTEGKSFKEKSAGFLAYMIGFFLLTGVVDTLMRFGGYDVYSLFILPVFRPAILLAGTSVIGLLGKKEGRIQWFFLALLLLFCLPGAYSAMLFHTVRPGLAWTIAGIFFAGSAGLFTILSRRNRY